MLRSPLIPFASSNSVPEWTAKSHPRTAFPAFARYGSDVLVLWDAEDEQTDPYLHPAILLGLALASRQRRPDDEGDLRALAVETRTH